MNNLVYRLLPTATNMIRLDHTHVMSTFHQYKASAPARVRKGLASTICTALEVHATLEEEIFYRRCARSRRMSSSARAWPSTRR